MEDLRTDELSHVLKEQVDLYGRMVRSVYGDRMLLATAASGLLGLGFGMLFAERWRTRAVGSLLYATGVTMELYAAMTPKHARERRGAERARPAEETRAA